jgi:hypothetical protein
MTQMNIELGKQYVTKSGTVTPPLKLSRTNATHKFTAWIQDPETSAGLIQPVWNELGKVASYWDASKLDLAKEYEPK